MNDYHQLLNFRGLKANMNYSENTCCQFPAHWHEEVEMFYNYTGTSHIQASQRVYTLNPGDLLVIASKDIHALVDESYSSRTMFQFHPSLFDDTINTPDLSKFIFSFINTTTVYQIESELIIPILENLKPLLSKYSDSMLAKAKTIELVFYLYEVYKNTIPLISTKQNPIIKSVEDYVENHYEETITLDHISSKVNLSKYYFSRYFKENKGVTFGQYLREFRIKKALKFLMETDMPVTNIAFTCGFDSIITFNRVFKHFTGLSPSSYRSKLIS